MAHLQEEDGAATPTLPVRQGYNPATLDRERRAKFGALLNVFSPQEIVDLIILNRLTDEVHEISKLLNQALR